MILYFIGKIFFYSLIILNIEGTKIVYLITTYLRNEEHYVKYYFLRAFNNINESPHI
jgi:hypothetical protein